MKTRTRITFDVMLIVILCCLIGGGNAARQNSAVAGVRAQNKNGAQNNAAKTRPNVLLIVLDDLNDYVGVLKGHPQTQTPNIDRLARNGVLFANAHSNAPICAPSRGSLFTGRYPHRSGYFDFTPWFENKTLAATPTLMRRLRDANYRAYGAGKLLHHNRASEWDEFGPAADYGPLAYDGKKLVAHPAMPAPFRNIGPLDGTFASLNEVPTIAPQGDLPGYTGWRYRGGREAFRYVSETDRALLPDEESAQWAIKKIAELEQVPAADAAPFFLAVGFIRPHTAHVVPQKWFDRFPLESLVLPLIKPDDKSDCFYESAVSIEQKGPQHFSALLKSYPSLETGLRAYLRGYLASVAFADDQVGQLLAALERSRFANNTIVVLTSDHGYHMGQKEYLFKNSLWEESTRVPLIIRAPGFESAAGQRVIHPVALIDLLPTITDLCGATRTAPADGFSLRPFLAAPTRAKWDGPPVALSVLRGNGNNGAPHFAVRSDRWRYIRYGNGSEELYDHAVDPHEWENLAALPEHAAVKRDLQAQLRALTGPNAIK
jgi:arylsulfatase A-like enzyme